MCARVIQKGRQAWLLSPLLILAAFIPANAFPVHEYQLELGLDGTMRLNSLAVEVKDFPEYRAFGSGGFYWQLIGNGSVLEESAFDVQKEAIIDVINPDTGKIEGGESINIELDRAVLYIPYLPNAEVIMIYNGTPGQGGVPMLEIDVSRYSKKPPQPKIDAQDVGQAGVGALSEPAEAKEGEEASKGGTGSTPLKKGLFAMLVSAGIIFLFVALFFLWRFFFVKYVRKR